MIPFNDLQRLNKSIFKEIERELQTLVNKGSFILSKEVELLRKIIKILQIQNMLLGLQMVQMP